MVTAMTVLPPIGGAAVVTWSLIIAQNGMSLTPRRHHRRPNDTLSRTIGDETEVTGLALQLGHADTPNAEASTVSLQYRRAASCPWYETHGKNP